MLRRSHFNISNFHFSYFGAPTVARRQSRLVLVNTVCAASPSSWCCRFHSSTYTSGESEQKNNHDESTYASPHFQPKRGIATWSTRKKLIVGLGVGVSFLLLSIIVTEMLFDDLDPNASHLHIPDDERTPRMKALDSSRAELYGKGMLSACTGTNPDMTPLHVARKFLAHDFPDLVASSTAEENREHYEKIMFLYVRHVPQFLAFVRNKTIKAGTYVDDGGLRRNAMKEFLGLNDRGQFDASTSSDRAKAAYERLSNLITFAVNSETNRVEPVPDQDNRVVGELRLPAQGDYLEKYLKNVQTWESFLRQNPDWRRNPLNIPVLHLTRNFGGTFYQRAIDLTVPDDLQKQLRLRTYGSNRQSNNNNNNSLVKNEHGTACSINPVLTLAHYGTLRNNEESKRNLLFPVSCWCFDAWDIARQDLSTPALTTLLFNTGNLSSIRLIEELFGVENVEAKVQWNSRFNDETENTSLIPQLEKFKAGLVPSFRLTKYFIEETKKGKSSFEWDENARNAEASELAAAAANTNAATLNHAMLLLGERRDKKSGKTFYLLQNWWEKSQFVELEREYLLRHVQHNARYQASKQFVCFLPPTVFYGKAKNPYIAMDVLPQVTRQVLLEFGDAELSQGY